MTEIRLPRNVFLWSMAIIYVFAFASFYVQIPGLYGNEGVRPVRLVEPGVSRDKLVLEQLKASPSLLWLGLHLGLELDAPQVMELLCLLGVVLALGAALLEPLRDSLVFFGLWALYLSLYQVGQDFMQFSWDTLLLEAGFLTILIAPLNLFRRRPAVRHHDALTFWLARWLLFRLTFGSGVAKLASHCPSWWGLTALSHLLETQGSPTPLAWWAHQLPDWILRLATVGVLVCETAVPLLYFTPIRCLRLGAFYIQMVHQGVSMLMGNPTTLNLLCLALSFSLLDDDVVSSWTGHSKKRRTKSWGQTLVSWLTLLVELSVYALILFCTKLLFKLEVNWEARTISSKTMFSQLQFDEGLKLAMVPTIWMGVLSLTWELVAAFLGLSIRLEFGEASCSVPYTAMEQVTSSKLLPELRRAYSLVERYRLVSPYALHSTVSQVDGRPEVMLEGSMDQTTWTEIEFMYKPGNETVAPPVVAPYQARLDWQMWQAAQRPAKHSPWFTGLVQRLLQGKKDVVSLLKVDQTIYPFSQAPPTFIRASLYKYWFTLKDQEGSSPKRWWRRHFVGEFYPTVQLGDSTLDNLLTQHGLKENVPLMLSADSFLSQTLRLVRGNIQTLPGPLVLWSLLATVVCIRLLKTLFLGGRKTKPASPEVKAKNSKERPAAPEKATTARENSDERRQGSDRSPRKRK
ncbi:lipase maturation factor 2b [Aplochiton taeniatus]